MNDKDKQLLYYIGVENSIEFTGKVKESIKSGASPNAATKDGWTVLMEAAHCGKSEIVKMLLSAGAEPNTAKGYGWTALMSAAFEGHSDVVRILLKNGAKPGTTLEANWNALSAANEAWSSAMPKDTEAYKKIVEMLRATGVKE